MDNFVITSSTFLSASSTSLEGLNQDDQECDHDDQDDQDDKDTKKYTLLICNTFDISPILVPLSLTSLQALECLLNRHNTEEVENEKIQNSPSLATITITTRAKIVENNPDQFWPGNNANNDNSND